MRAPAFLLVLLTLAGCASMRVDTEYDASTSFDAYRTFAWMERPDAVRDNLTDYGQIAQRIERAVERELAADGYALVGEAPDFYVVYHAGVETQVSTATIGTWGYRRPRWHTGPVYADVEVTTYQEGTLILDIVDAEKNELVWRGTAVDAVGDADRAARKAEEAVQAMLAEFPPARDA